MILLRLIDVDDFPAQSLPNMRNEDKLWLLQEMEAGLGSLRQTGPFTYAQLQQRYTNQEIGGNTLCFSKKHMYWEGCWRPLREYFPCFEVDGPPDPSVTVATPPAKDTTAKPALESDQARAAAVADFLQGYENRHPGHPARPASKPKTPGEQTLCFVHTPAGSHGPHVMRTIKTMWDTGVLTADATVTWENSGEPIQLAALMLPQASNPIPQALPKREASKEAEIAPIPLWLKLAIVAFSIWLFLGTRLSDSLDGAIDEFRASHSFGSAGISKAIWRSKVPNTQTGRLSGMMICKKADLIDEVGEPDSSEIIGDQIYLSWECSDGTMQIVCNAIGYDPGGTVIGHINSN